MVWGILSFSPSVCLIHFPCYYIFYYIEVSSYTFTVHSISSCLFNLLCPSLILWSSYGIGIVLGEVDKWETVELAQCNASLPSWSCLSFVFFNWEVNSTHWLWFYNCANELCYVLWWTTGGREEQWSANARIHWEWIFNRTGELEVNFLSSSWMQCRL